MDADKLEVRKSETSLQERMECRELIRRFEAELAKRPDAIFGDSDAAPLVHTFCDGFYVRQITLPAGFLTAGKIHRCEHPSFLLSGKVTFITEHDGKKTIEAPQVMVSKAGTKRLVFAHTESVWVTVHLNPTNTRDLKELEEMIIAKDYGEFEDIIDQKEIA